MIALLQRVTEASVEIDDEVVANINAGLLVFIGVERGDDDADARRMVDRILDYRIFADGQGRMNSSLRDVSGGLLLVPQFTLAADTARGTRPSLSPAAMPDDGRRIFSELVSYAHCMHQKVASGQFGANMSVRLTNAGPVTFILKI